MDDGGDFNPDIDEAGFVFDTVTFDADLSNGIIDIVTGGATRIGSAGIRVNNIGLQLIDVEGALSFSDLDIATEGELGLDVFGAGPTPAGFELDILAGDIDALDGQALYLENATLDVTLSSVTSTNAFGCCFSTGDGIALINLAGSFEVTGTTTVTGAQANGILIEDSAASIAFGTTDVAMSGGPGKSGIDFAGTNTSVTFGTTTVSGIGESQTGIDFSNSATTAAFGLTTISSPTGSGGSIGIDLSGTLGNRTITFAQRSDIDNLNVGVQLGTAGRGGATANATFIFGDGDAVDGLESFITATAGDYTVDTIGLDPASGSYDFDDVDFTGDANLLVAPDSATFVSQSGGQFTAGGALGLSQTIDTISLADADALTAAGTVFAFVGPINLAAAGFDLDAGQSITGFGNGNIVSFGTIQPANVFGDLGATGAAVTGNETTIIGTDTLFTLAGGNEIRHTTFDLSSGVVGSAVFAASTIAAGNDITIEGVTITGVGQGRIAFDLTNIASDTFIQNNDISIAGTLLDISGGSGDVTVTHGTLPNGGPAGALSAGQVIVGARLAGSAVTFTDQLTLSSGADDAVLLTGNTGAAVSFAGLDITTTAGRGFVATGGGTVNVSGTGNTIATTTGTALVLSGVTAGITLDSVTAGGGANGISIVNVDNSAISITGDVSIDDATSAGIFVQNSDNTTFTVGGLTTIVNDLGLGTVAHGADLQTNAGSTFNFNGGVDIFVDGANAFGFRAQSSGTVNILDPNGTNEITSQNGTALLINPTTVNITLANLTAGGGLNGVFLDQMSGSLTVTGTVTINDSGADGLRIAGSSGVVNFNSIVMNGAGGSGIELSNNTGAITISGGSIGDTNDAAAVGVAVIGGNANVTIDADITKTTAFNVVAVSNRTGGTVSFGGDISAIGGVDNGISASFNSGGTITFSGAKTLSTGASTAVALSSNTGATISFSGGGLDIDTTTGVGFSATGGGTVAVQGTGNSIASVSAAALNVQDTFIGASGLTFQRIEAGNATAAADPANGIVLNATGTTAGTHGGLTVTGTGTTNGSGGIIQNIGTRGVSIINARAISLSNMTLTNANMTDGTSLDLDISASNAAIYLSGVTGAALNNIDINGTADNGITGLNVSNFTMDNSTITQVGNNANESGIEFSNLSGTSSISNTSITFSETNSLDIVNTDVNLNLTLNNVTFSDTQTVSSGGATNLNGEGGLQFRSFSSAAGAPVTDINVLDSDFLRLRTQGIQVIGEDDSIVNVDITNNVIGSEAGVAVVDPAINIGAGIDINGNDIANVTFNIIGNAIQSRGGAAANITSFLDSNVEGRINNNAITVNGIGSGVRTVAQETSNMIVEVRNNNITMGPANNSTSIDAQARFQTARLDLTLDNNTLDSDPTAVADINITSGSSAAGESNLVFVNIINNTIVPGGPTNILRLRVSDLSNTNRLFLQGFVEGGAGLDDDAVATWNANGNTPAATTANVNVSLTDTAIAPSAGVALVPDNPQP